MIEAHMHKLYGIDSKRSDESNLITVSTDVLVLMGAADSSEYNFFLIKRESDDEEIWGSRIGWADDVMWRRKHQPRKRGRDRHVFESIKKLITRKED